MNKKQIIDQIIAVEGGYVNDPSDSGGETMYGVTVAVARENGYTGPMSQMPRSIAEQIYSARYWDAVQADSLIESSPRIAEEVVDTGVNMGPGRAAKILQRALNIMNLSGNLYSDLIIDGDIGPATFRALNEYLARRDEETLLKTLNVLQGYKYIELAERREKDEKFVYGWIKNRVQI
jgi:lysozyme family protein